MNKILFGLLYIYLCNSYASGLNEEETEKAVTRSCCRPPITDEDPEMHTLNAMKDYFAELESSWDKCFREYRIRAKIGMSSVFYDISNGLSVGHKTSRPIFTSLVSSSSNFHGGESSSVVQEDLILTNTRKHKREE